MKFKKTIFFLSAVFLYHCTVADGGGSGNSLFEGAGIEDINKKQEQISNLSKITNLLDFQQGNNFNDGQNESKKLSIPQWLAEHWDLVKITNQILKKTIKNINKGNSNFNIKKIYSKNGNVIFFEKDLNLWNLSDYVAQKNYEVEETIQDNFYQINLSKEFSTNRFFYRFQKIENYLYFSTHKKKNVKFVKIDKKINSINKILPRWIEGNWYNRNGGEVKVTAKYFFINGIKIKQSQFLDNFLVEKDFIFFLFKKQFFLLKKKSHREIKYQSWQKEIVRKYFFYKVTLSVNNPPQVLGKWQIVEKPNFFIGKKKITNERVSYFLTNVNSIKFTTNRISIDNKDISKKDFYFYQRFNPTVWNEKSLPSFNFYFYYFFKKKHQYFFRWQQVNKNNAKLIFQTGEEINIIKRGL